jgi:hypothetical protein
MFGIARRFFMLILHFEKNAIRIHKQSRSSLYSTIFSYSIGRILCDLRVHKLNWKA